jgi:hypothetical protein
MDHLSSARDIAYSSKASDGLAEAGFDPSSKIRFLAVWAAVFRCLLESRTENMRCTKAKRALDGYIFDNQSGGRNDFRVARDRVYHTRLGAFTSASSRCLDSGDIDFLHRHHRFEGAFCLAAASRKRIG